MSSSPIHTAGSLQPRNGNFWLQFSAHQAVRSHSPRGMHRLHQAIAFIHNDATPTLKVNETLTTVAVLYPRKASPQGARSACRTYLCSKTLFEGMGVPYGMFSKLLFGRV